MTSIDDIIASAKPREASVTICVAGDLAGQYEALARDLAEANEQARTSLADGGQAVAIAQQMEQLREQMKAAEVTFTFRAVGRRRWSDLLAEHPPRENQPERYNLATLPLAVVQASCVEPAMTADQAERLADALSDGAFNELFDAAWRANTDEGRVPFSQAASATIAASAQS